MTDHEHPTIVTREPLRAVVVQGQDVPMAQIRDFFDASFQTVGQALQEQEATPTSGGFARYDRRPTDTVDLAVGFGVGPGIVATDSVQIVEIPGGRAGELVHAGGYDSLGASWERLAAWVQEQDETLGSWFLEEYLTEPTPEADPADMRTRLTYSLADR